MISYYKRNNKPVSWTDGPWWSTSRFGSWSHYCNRSASGYDDDYRSRSEYSKSVSGSDPDENNEIEYD